MNKCLAADVRLAGLLDTHLALFPPFVLPDRPLQSTMEPRSRSTPEAPTTTSSSPLTRSRSVVPRQEASPFRSLLFCASLLKADHVYLVSVLTYYCFR